MRSQHRLKAQRSGFETERRSNRGNAVFGRSRKAEDGNGMTEICDDEGQAKKSARGMPWHQEPMKDVISCERLRGAANEQRSGDI